MFQTAWACFLYIYGILTDVLLVCNHASKLRPNDLNRQQYFGDWYFIAAAASEISPSLEAYTQVDNTVFNINEETRPDRLLLRATIRTKDGSCVPRKWIYLVKEDSVDLGTEGRPDRNTELFASKCPRCIILQESDPHIVQRLLLFSRTPQLDQEYIDDFKTKASCAGMHKLLLFPQANEYCKFEPTGVHS
ncbi:apolipoprotein M isoform X1 [Ambystoma mexicanum]|uniref:apolipoprotein M isoform X1 n=1 Tax=Ambystoma mexicanum TaxID=8296 RepID=UPI0037E72FA9